MAQNEAIFAQNTYKPAQNQVKMIQNQPNMAQMPNHLILKANKQSIITLSPTKL